MSVKLLSERRYKNGNIQETASNAFSSRVAKNLAYIIISILSSVLFRRMYSFFQFLIDPQIQTIP